MLGNDYLRVQPFVAISHLQIIIYSLSVKAINCCLSLRQWNVHMGSGTQLSHKRVPLHIGIA